MTYKQAYESGDEEDKYILSERAAIEEFDGGLPRVEAEIRSVRAWLKTKMRRCWQRLRQDAGLLD